MIFQSGEHKGQEVTLLVKKENKDEAVPEEKIRRVRRRQGLMGVVVSSMEIKN